MALALRAATSAAPSVALAWDPNSEPDLGGYKLYYGPASGLYTNAADVGLVTNATVAGLVAGARYFLVVTAYNSAGLESDPSNEISYIASGANTAPFISPIANRSTRGDAPSPVIAFTVGDAETPASSLSVSATSSNPTLLPTSGLLLDGSGSNRTLVLFPVLNLVTPNLSGTATVTLSVSDGALSRTTAFLLTVLADSFPTNTPPFVSALPDKTVNEDASLTLTFLVTDAETPPGNLAVLATTSNPQLFPGANIVLGGSGSHRSATLFPARDQSGAVMVTLTVSDGALSASSSFVLTVTPVNDPPSLYRISSPTVFADRPASPLPFSIVDIDTPAGDLRLSATSSNPALLPEANIRFGVDGTNQTVTLTPAPAETGTAVVMVTVSDGESVASQVFDLTVIEAPPRMVYLPMQAEAASLVAPMNILSNAVPTNTVCIAASSSDQGTASFSFECPFSGTYVIWARVWAPDTGHDSFHVALDDGPEDVYDCAEGIWASAWQWTRVTGRDGKAEPFPTLNPRILALSAGAHELRFRGREANTRLDQILVSNDLDFVPQDPASVVAPAILSVTAEGAAVTVRWQAQPGMTYRVACKEHPEDPAWAVLGTTIVATSNEVTWVSPPDSDTSSRFYTVLALPW